MALQYVPQQAQVPSININTFQQAQAQASFPTPHTHNPLGGCCDEENVVQTGPTELCFTVDLSNTNAISFAKWDGTNAQPILEPITPPLFPLPLPISTHDTTDPTAIKTTKDVNPFDLIINSNLTDETSPSKISLNKNIKGASEFFKFVYNKAVTANPDNTEGSTTTATTTKKKKNKQILKLEKNITIITRPTCPMNERRFLVEAVKKANWNVKNILTSDLAHVAYTYHQLDDHELFFGSKLDCDIIVVTYNDTAERVGVTGSPVTYVSLIRCEISPSAPHNVDRIYSIGAIELSDRITDATSLKIDSLIQQAGVGKDEIKGIIYSITGSDSSLYEKTILKTLATTYSLPSTSILSSTPAIVALGGCLLSAAETESSKEYIQDEEGKWKIVYQLPVADTYIPGEVGLFTLSSNNEPSPQKQGGGASGDSSGGDWSAAEALFKGNRQVTKMTHGVVRPMKGKILLTSLSLAY